MGAEDDEFPRLRDAKISLIVLLGLFTFAASLVPWIAKRLFKRAPLDALNVVTAFAAVRGAIPYPPYPREPFFNPLPSPPPSPPSPQGIVFGTLMLHMIPHGSEEFKEYLAEYAYKMPEPEEPEPCPNRRSLAGFRRLS